MFIRDINNSTLNMPHKKFNPLSEHGFIGESKTKSKPKPYVESEWIAEYRRDRDICLFIQKGIGEFSEEEVEVIRGKYFKTLF